MPKKNKIIVKNKIIKKATGETSKNSQPKIKHESTTFATIQFTQSANRLYSCQVRVTRTDYS